jgi:FkbM family methyltransferase
MPGISWKPYLRRLLPRRVRSHRILAGPLRGLRIMTSWHDYPAAILGRTERPLLDWFDLNVAPGETWLDIGAHYGYTALALSRSVGPRGRVFAFEPMPATFGYLATTGELNGLSQLRAMPFGLGAPETIEMRRLGTVRGMADSTVAGDGAFMVARLDWLWPRISERDQAIHGVKIDVEGMELEVIEGMADLLRERAPKLVVEVHHGVDRTRLLSLLAAAGYPGPAIPIEHDPAEPALLDGHSYYLHPSA